MLFEFLTPEEKEDLNRSWAMRKALKLYAIDRKLAKAACADGNFDSMRKFCGFLLDNLRDRRLKQKAGEKHLATKANANLGHLPDWVISAFITQMLSACRKRNFAPPQELCDLIETQLRHKTGRTGYRDAKNVTAMIHAMYLLAESPDKSSSEIAITVGVHRTTVQNWRKDPDFIDILAAIIAKVQTSWFERALARDWTPDQVE